MSPPRNTYTVEAIIKAAEIHGRESEPEHEIGDLQESLRYAWALMNADQRGVLIAKCADILSWR